MNFMPRGSFMTFRQKWIGWDSYIIQYTWSLFIWSHFVQSGIIMIWIYWCGPRPSLGGTPKSLRNGTDIGDTEGDFVARGERDGWKLGDNAFWDSMSWAIGDWLALTGTNLLPMDGWFLMVKLLGLETLLELSSSLSFEISLKTWAKFWYWGCQSSK